MSPKSRIHEISDRFVEDYARHDPILATLAGIDGYDDQLTDFSPDGVRARAEVGAAALREINAEIPVDDADRVAQAVFAERADIADAV